MDTIIMGRKMTAGFISYWENMVNNQPDSPEYTYAKIFVDTPKIVFSKTTSSIDGKNATVENGDLVGSVNKLKMQEGKDIIVYGGAFPSPVSHRTVARSHCLTSARLSVGS